MTGRQADTARRVAIVLPDLAGGGAQRVMLQVAAGLARDTRFSPHLLVLGGSRDFLGEVPAGVPLEIGSASRVRQGLPWLVSRLRALEPGIAVSVMGYLNLMLLAARPMLPRTLGIVAREANALVATDKALPRWMPTARLYSALYPRAAAIVSPSREIADDIAGRVPGARARIVVVPNPVDVGDLRDKATPPQRRPGPGLRLVAAGRLTGQKGFDRLLPLMRELPPDTHLTIFGRGPDRDALEAEIVRSGLGGRVDLPGFSRELPAAIAGADAFLLPSRWEGLPNVALESLALGTPVIASGEAAVAELGLRAGPAVEIGAPELDFAAAIMRLRPSPPGTAPRASLLPDVYLRDAVVARWVDLLCGIASAPEHHSRAML